MHARTARTRCATGWRSTITSGSSAATRTSAPSSATCCHLDNRCPGDRAEFLSDWTDLLLSAAPGLQDTGKISTDVIEGMKTELALVGRDPNAVFFYSFVQAQARVW